MNSSHTDRIEIKCDQASSRDDTPNPSLLSILDDKNKEIADLRKKIASQKSQLAYYIRKETNWDKIASLSECCDSIADVTNLPLNLALHHFCNRMGLQNRVVTLHSGMSKAGVKIATTLNRQETLLNRIVSNVCKLARRECYDIGFGLTQFTIESKHLELFNNLLMATKTLKRELAMYRNCCNRLIAIEDERNSIVEQIYSLPAEQRTNANYLMRLESEKVELKNELKVISKRQKLLEEKITDISCLYNDNIKEIPMEKILENVHTDAVKLLDVTKKHTNCIPSMECLGPKLSLEQVLTYIRVSFDKKNSPKIFKLSPSSAALFRIIQNEIEKEKQQLQADYTKEMVKKTSECNILHRRLHEMTQECYKLNGIIQKMQKDLKEIKIANKEEINRVSMERDSYKTQVADLEVIRTAYAEVVEKQTDIATIEKNYHMQIIERDKTVAELQEENHMLSMQLMTYQQNFIQLQADLIKQLKKISSTTDVLRCLSTEIGEQIIEQNESEEKLQKSVTCCDMKKSTVELTEVGKSGPQAPVLIPLNSLINTHETNNIVIQIDGGGGGVQVMNNNMVCLKFINAPTPAARSPSPITQINNCEYDDHLLMKDSSNESVPGYCAPCRTRGRI